MKKIIVINGTAGIGKDTFVTFCKKYAKVVNYDTVGYIKEIAKMMGWDGIKDEKSRKLLSDLKLLSVKYNDFPFLKTKEVINSFLEDDNELLFIHAREPEEIDKLVREYDVKTLLLRKKGVKNLSSNSADSNVDNYTYDFTITFDTIDHAMEKACLFVDKMRNE